ncbi:MAG: RraA family protein [Lachnospiraceae bacterium]|nr:RraA family protein [Lachnospiraceae bacterium]
MKFNDYNDIVQLTNAWQGERMMDGRPKVPDEYLDKLKNLTLEEVWKPIYLKGYDNQFEGRLKLLHNDGRKLIGRAVTASYCPMRPDLNDAVKKQGDAEGRTGTYNQWVIDSLTEGDVVVVDMYDKIYKGTFLGGNLTTAVKAKTKTGGGIIWGGIRDLEQMEQIKEVQVYYRGIDPTPIREFIMTGFNGVTKIGNAVCLPGDIVFGTTSGVLFIPSHLVEDVVDGALKTKVKDIFGFEMISQNRFTTAQIDMETWTQEMLDLLLTFIAEDERGIPYREINWEKEYLAAKEGDEI